VREDMDDSLERQGRVGVDLANASASDGAGHHHPVRQPWHARFGRVDGLPRHLQPSVKARHGATNGWLHNEGAAAAHSRARTMARRASSILNSLCWKVRAPSTVASATRSNVARVGAASTDQHGFRLHATPGSMGDATEGQPRLSDERSVQLESCRDRHEGES
jgi:hypothetical protein